MNSGFSKPKMVASMVEREAFCDHVVKDAADIVLRPNPHILLSLHREHTHKILYPSRQPFWTSQMGLSLTFGYVLLLFLSYKFVILPLFFSPLSTIPKAHFTSHLSNGWIILQRYCGRENKAIYNAHQRLGPIVRIGPKALSVNSADALKVIYSDRFDKDEFYTAFANYGSITFSSNTSIKLCLQVLSEPNMFSMIQRKPHADRKRKLGRIYSKSSLQSSSVIRDLCQELVVARLLPIIEKSAVKGSPVNMLEYSSAVYMDFISSFIFGVQNSAKLFGRFGSSKGLAG
jgi:unspecific monooxygenase